jgi:hypothetical protein
MTTSIVEVPPAAPAPGSREDPALNTQAEAPDVRAELEQARAALADSQRTLGAIQQRREIEQALAEQGAIDLDSAVLLVEQAMAAGSADGSAGLVAGAVAALQRSKPLLFRPPAGRRTSAMAGEVSSAPVLDSAALEARQTGDRRALMRYLRLRRGC